LVLKNFGDSYKALGEPSPGHGGNDGRYCSLEHWKTLGLQLTLGSPCYLNSLLPIQTKKWPNVQEDGPADFCSRLAADSCPGYEFAHDAEAWLRPPQNKRFNPTAFSVSDVEREEFSSYLA
jgi:hypothetical protein